MESEIKKKRPRVRLSPADRRAQLLCCAVSALAEHGVARATHAHVAERAGVSIAAVHSYFRTRRDLIADTLSTVEQYLLDMVTRVSAEDRPAREALTLMVRSFDQAAQEQPDVFKVWLDWSTGVRADVWHNYLQMQLRVIDAVIVILRRGQQHNELCRTLDVDAAARLFVGGGHTVALARFANASQNQIESLIAHLVESVLNIGHPR